MRITLAAGTLLGAFVGVTAAAYLDEATVKFEPVGAVYDIAFADAAGNTQQGSDHVYEFDASELPPIMEAGGDKHQQMSMVFRNVGTAASGRLTVTAESLLPPQPADEDGVVRDPFDVLIVSVWDEDGTRLADEVPADELNVEIPAWPGGTDRTVTFQFSYRQNLGTPYYYGKDVRIGITASGVSA